MTFPHSWHLSSCFKYGNQYNLKREVVSSWKGRAFSQSHAKTQQAAPEGGGRWQTSPKRSWSINRMTGLCKGNLSVGWNYSKWYLRVLSTLRFKDCLFLKTEIHSFLLTLQNCFTILLCKYLIHTQAFGFWLATPHPWYHITHTLVPTSVLKVFFY